ncbi:uncharacterized protein LOC143732379 [Siphateles boraxobius]|uniref:uncharacterized protein LOC143732379 n=1 Tax=Siphateles boraxobius TaxID=180520 RepID=UPI004063F361
MKHFFQVLLLVVMFALKKCQEYQDYDEPAYYSVDTNNAVFDITVYRHMEDRQRVIVVCMFDRMFKWGYTRWIQPFELSVESELNYTKEKVDCTSVETRITCVYMVTVSPPASFTCEREVHSNGDFINMRTQTYTYKRSVLDYHEEGVSSSCTGFSSFLAVDVFIMTVAVIVT